MKLFILTLLFPLFSSAGFNLFGGAAAAAASRFCDPASVVCEQDEFMGLNGTGSSLQWAATSANGGGVQMSSTACTVAGNPGHVELRTGVSTNGGELYRTEPDAYELMANSTIRYRIYLPDLSDGTDTYALAVGSADYAGATTVDATDGIYLVYDTAGTFMAVGSVNWHIVTANAGVRTETDTGIAVVEDAYMNVEWSSNAAKDTITFTIDGTSAGTETLTIPGVGRQFAIGNTTIISSAGTAQRRYCIDYYDIEISGLSR